MESANKRFSELISAVEDDLSSGLLYTHTRINDNTKKVLESSSFLYGLIELLSEKGMITIGELDERKKQVAERLVRRFTESGLGLMYRESECDKYAFAQEAHVDCQSRLSICKSICAASIPLRFRGRMWRKEPSGGSLAGPISLNIEMTVIISI